MNEMIVAIRENLRRGRYINEASVSQGIVLQILSNLGWPTFDTTVVSPEFSLSGTRVDYALCHPPLKPVVLLEVKQVGLGSDAERQLFGYAVHHGVPMAVLTTGQEWHFFLPGERGDYEERRVYMLDLLERDPEECVARLTRYLAFPNVCSGEALEAARSDYRDVAKQREINKVLPEAWNKLVNEADESLLELVADKVESLCGYKPNLETVASFLSATQKPMPSGSLSKIRPASSSQSHRVQPASRAPLHDETGKPSFVINGERYSASSGRDLLIKFLQRIAEWDPSFPERFAARTQSDKRRRRLARSPLELFPGSPHLAEDPSHSRELFPGSGWWVDLNLSRGSIGQVIKIACEVANLEYGVDVKVNL